MYRRNHYGQSPSSSIRASQTEVRVLAREQMLRFLNLEPIDIFAREFFILTGDPVHYRLVSRIPDLYPLNAKSTHPLTVTYQALSKLALLVGMGYKITPIENQ